MALLIAAGILILPSCKTPRKSGNNATGNHEREFRAGQLADASNRFALDLFRKVQPEKENIIFSSYSISNTMALIYGGASGRTAGEISEVLYYPGDPMQLHKAVKNLGSSLDSVNLDSGTELRTANALWVQDNFNFLPGYLKLGEEFYQAVLDLVDFRQSGNREAARQRINNWIEERTNLHIKDMIQPGILDANTRMVLTNAIYFNGKWKYPFHKSSTSASLFHVSAEESVSVNFMNQKETYPYYEDDEIQAIILPYQGSRMSMLIILPKKVEDWKMVSRVLDYSRTERVISNLVPAEVQLALPRFKTEMGSNLREIFESMGIEEAFTMDADLSGMTGEKNLFISEVIHKACIEVTEAGTEAAAATAGVIALKSALTEEPVHFRADHPFIYFLRDEKTGCILFSGRLVRPSDNF